VLLLPSAFAALSWPAPEAAAESPGAKSREARLRALRARAEREAKSGSYDEAAESLTEALQLEEELHGRQSREVAHALLALVDVHGQRRDYLKVKRYAWRIVQMAEARVAFEHVIMSSLAAKLAHVFTEQGMPPAKQPLFERAVVWVGLNPQPQDAFLASALVQSGDRFFAAGDLDAAEPLYRLAIKIGQPSLTTNAEYMAHAYTHLGLLQLQRQQVQKAKRQLQIAIRLRESQPDYKRNAEYGRALQSLGIVYYLETRHDSAIYVLTRARAVYQRADAWQEPQVQSLLETLARAYMARERWEEARDTLRELFQWIQETLGPRKKALLEVNELYDEVQEEIRLQKRRR
jgi:tetratricopeptide (TPR) repeat protein